MLTKTNPAHLVALESPCAEDGTGGVDWVRAAILTQEAIERAKLELPAQRPVRQRISDILHEIRSKSPIKSLEELRKPSAPEILAEIKKLWINFYQ